MPPVSEQAPGRALRSRLDRPCDACRRSKHACIMPAADSPCVNCTTRKRRCTFDLPPTERKRPRRDGSGAAKKETGMSSRASSHPIAPNDPGVDWAEGPVSRAPDVQNGSGWGAKPPAPQIGAVRCLEELTAVRPSLDMSNTHADESHFIGTGAFFGLMPKDAATPDGPSPAFARHANLAFRQVSADSRLPAYFIKYPALIYGPGLRSAEQTFHEVLQLCSGVMDGVLDTAMDKFIGTTFPAMPFVTSGHLRSAARGEGNTAVPYAFLSAIISHCTSYFPALRPIHKKLWAEGLFALDDGYRQPQLRVIQLALLVLTSRPSDNAGQREIGLARAIGAAHLLGLHMDPTNWELPLWERSVRMRIWWSLMIHDKWSAVVSGRPTHMHPSNYNVPIPTHDLVIEDEAYCDRLSIDSFIASARLTVVIDKVLDNFFSVRAITNPPTGLTRIATLESLRAEVELFDEQLPEGLRVDSAGVGTAPTGVRSFQMSLCGLQIVIHRLIVESFSSTHSPHVAIALRAALYCCQRATNIVLGLKAADLDLFWMPYTAHHISNGASLLLRIALYDRNGDLGVLSDATRVMSALVDGLITLHRTAPHWDVAEGALRRILTLLFIASREMAQFTSTYRAVADVFELSVPDPDAVAATQTDQLLESLGLNPDESAAFPEMDMSWLDSGMLFEALESWMPNMAAGQSVM